MGPLRLPSASRFHLRIGRVGMADLPRLHGHGERRDHRRLLGFDCRLQFSGRKVPARRPSQGNKPASSPELSSSMMPSAARSCGLPDLDHLPRRCSDQSRARSRLARLHPDALDDTPACALSQPLWVHRRPKRRFRLFGLIACEASACTNSLCRLSSFLIAPAASSRDAGRGRRTSRP
jgi:hypothetical protein